MRTFAEKEKQPANSRSARIPLADRAGPVVAAHATSLSPGAPLDPVARSLFEPLFRHDFSSVRVHADGAAERAARAVGASAYTVGDDVVFGAGRYRPNTLSGQILLAHELTHVAQQRLGGAPAREVGSQEDPDERQAEGAANAIRWGSMEPRYSVVASDVVWETTSRPRPALPALAPALAVIQRVQLTYDDGPDSAGNTRTVLAALNAAGAHATFYLVGKRVAQGTNWRIVFDIAAAGHWLGNHAYDWNDATDNHIFLSGTPEQRAQKILQTEWAIRDALIQGREDAKKNKSWDSIPQTSRDYIEDVTSHGTGRFRTPGFQSKAFDPRLKDEWTGTTTRAALASANQVLAATGLRPLVVTEVGFFGSEGVTVDPDDWRSGRSQAEIESRVKGELTSDKDSILLHSRIPATAAATPAILADIKSRKWSFDPTAQGTMGSVGPKPGFAGISTISDPPTSSQIGSARAFLKKGIPGWGPVVCGSVAIGILQLAQRAGPAEVNAFLAEVRATTVEVVNYKGAKERIPLANWLSANEQWRLFAGFYENWALQRPFPRIKGVTI
jgi:peptidoglycan/xylan/chitin deacetylase (PgdA/CDA1 family)